MLRRLSLVASLLGLTTALTAAGAAPAPQEWGNWRGPHYNGSSDETGLPAKFSRTEGVKWTADLPGTGAATPIVWGDNVFISAADEKAQKLLALCLDRKTGQVRWQREPGTGYRPSGIGTPTRLDERSNYASPSPVTDGKRVIFFYGNGDLAAFTMDGKPLWARNLQKEDGDFCFGWTFSSSPQLYEGRLYFQRLQRNLAVGGRGKDGQPSYLLALDPATGKELWRVERPSDARMESREAFTTPIPFEENGRREILLAGSDMLSGHDPATGKELWRWGTWNPGHMDQAYRLVTSPVAGAGLVLGCGPKRRPVYAVRAWSTGDVSTSGLAWQSEERGPITTDVPTPAFYHGKFYVLSDQRKALSCVEPADGKVAWSTPITGSSACWASPTVADGRIYLLSLRGEVYTVDAQSGQMQGPIPMADDDENDLRSGITVSHGNLFVRTAKRLYCVGK